MSVSTPLKNSFCQQSDFSPSITQVEIKGKRKIKNDSIKLIKYHLKVKNYINENKLKEIMQK